ncbi:unnamed protein product [Gemmata massiliana]|uniref:Lipoprotein n=1 Tax=Gemmata massiliana TaxID=1210884 RepID=A0A6P2DHG4_9BACT|nr:hypothetical protein [Gemmata massiliana]VTS01387.1 unnamed protein product [Gemmata massiliana]
MPVRLVFVCLIAALCCGCSPGGATLPAETSGTHTWSGPADGVPGLDSGTCYYVGKRFIIWAADTRGGGGGGHTGDATGVRGNGHISFVNAPTLTFSFQLPHGKPGTAVVDGTEYDLSESGLVLVKREGDKFVVKQLAKDLSGFDAQSANFSTYGRADPQIKAFFEGKP